MGDTAKTVTQYGIKTNMKPNTAPLGIGLAEIKRLNEILVHPASYESAISFQWDVLSTTVYQLSLLVSLSTTSHGGQSGGNLARLPQNMTQKLFKTSWRFYVLTE